MSLIFEDRFESGNMDTYAWVPEVRDDGCGNRELQLYRSENVSVENNRLVIKAERIAPRLPGTAPTYKSARVQLRHPAVSDFKYGRIEVCAKLPQGFGIWPAIWLLPVHDAYGGWPNSGEIDIAEIRGQFPAKLKGTIHFGKPRDVRSIGESMTCSDKDGFAAGFHEYAVEWRPDSIKWFVNGHNFHTCSAQAWQYAKLNEKRGPAAPFDQPFYLILNVAVGGGFLENPGTENDVEYPAQFPAKMEVDYVRVFKF